MWKKQDFKQLLKKDGTLVCTSFVGIVLRGFVRRGLTVCCEAAWEYSSRKVIELIKKVVEEVRLMFVVVRISPSPRSRQVDCHCCQGCIYECGFQAGYMLRPGCSGELLRQSRKSDGPALDSSKPHASIN